MAEYAKLKSLIELPKGKKATAQHINKAAGGLAAALKKERAAGRFRVGVLDKGKETKLSIDHAGGASKVSADAGGRANLEVRASRETLTEIATGRLSPVDAYLTGRLQLRGDLEYGKRVYARAAARGRRDV